MDAVSVLPTLKASVVAVGHFELKMATAVIMDRPAASRMWSAGEPYRKGRQDNNCLQAGKGNPVIEKQRCSKAGLVTGARENESTIPVGWKGAYRH
jgi:hypothetical protein